MAQVEAGLPLDGEVIRRLVEERFEGSWGKFHKRSCIHRTTVNRWINGEHLPQQDKFLQLCGALDVDFFALFDLTVDHVPDLAQQAAMSLVSNSWQGPLSPLGFLQSFLLMPGDWPGKQLLPYYELMRERTWHTWDYYNDPRTGASDCYCTFTLKGSTDPQVWYFAFREKGVLSWMWFRYGCVRKRWDEALLMNYVFLGEIETYSLNESDDTIIVQTHMSERPTTFRLASLHPFEASASLETPEKESFLRFRKPGP